jgi:hypothetical protein
MHSCNSTRKKHGYFLYDISWNRILKIVEMLRMQLVGTSNYIDLVTIGVIATG